MNRLLVIATLILVNSVIWASSSDDCRRSHDQCGHTDDTDFTVTVTDDDDININLSSGGNNQAQSQSQRAESSSDATANASVDGIGNSQSTTFTNRQQVPNIYMNQSGNIVSCIRIIGLGGANKDASFIFGIPAGRNKTCDIWRAVEEAQQNGHVYTSYVFMCSIKVIRKTWTDAVCYEFEEKSLDELGIELFDSNSEVTRTPELDDVYNKAAQWDERWLYAQVTEDEYNEQQEMVEDRIEQQQRTLDERAVLIDEYSKKTVSQEAEIEALRKAQEIRKVEEEATKAKFRAKIAAKQAAQEQEDET